MKKTFSEQVKDLENTRAAKVAELETLAGKAVEEERSMDEDEQSTFDELTAEIKAVDGDLKRLRELADLTA